MNCCYPNLSEGLTGSRQDTEKGQIMMAIEFIIEQECEGTVDGECQQMERGWKDLKWNKSSWRRSHRMLSVTQRSFDFLLRGIR